MRLICAATPLISLDMALSEKEVDRLLERQPSHVPALVRKGDLRMEARDGRAASAFYKAALSAVAGVHPLPVEAQPFIERARAGLSRAGQLFEDHLERRLTRAGLPPERCPRRFAESLEILTGRRAMQSDLQRPAAYFFPGLPQRRYYERSEFSWVPRVEEAVPAIRDELSRLRVEDEAGFRPYLVSDPRRPRRDFHGLTDNPDWSTLHLWENGAPVAENAERCPATFATIRSLDLPFITTRAPSILFSRLRAGARIPPHSGMLNTRLICHLPLVVPEGCGFRVGGETREWREGELLIFDDTVEHEAWNDGSSDRIVLIFDIWRPELSEEERRAVTAMFEAIDAY
jgi:aspartyl/asparaginyl beta-hydroxylase (cupin superfamily)